MMFSRFTALTVGKCTAALLTFALPFLLTGCDGCKTGSSSSGKSPADTTLSVHNSTVRQDTTITSTVIPDDWFTNPPVAPGFHYEVGTGLSVDRGMALNKARHDAMRRLAQWQESQVVTGDGGVTTSTSETTLQGVKVVKTEHLQDGNKFRVYVLMELPLSPANTTANAEDKNSPAVN